MPLVQPTLAVAALAAGGAAAVYLYLGRMLTRRVAPDAVARRALVMFSVWWTATGANIALAAILILAAAFGWTSFAVQMAYTVVQRLLLAVALVGLAYYLFVLVLGLAPVRMLVILYSAYFVVLLGTLYASQPDGVYVGDWRLDVSYAAPEAVPTWLTAVLGAFLVLPPVVLSGAAIALARRLPADRHPQRNRITIVGVALIAWWVVAVVAGQRATFDEAFFQLFNRLLGLAMALAIFAAYHPPAWLWRHVEDGPRAPSTRGVGPAR